MTSGIVKILFLSQFCLSLCAHDIFEPAQEEAMPILVSMGSAYSMPDTKIETGIFEFGEIALVAVIESHNEYSNILFFNFDETCYLGSLEVHCSIHSLKLRKNRLVIKGLSSMGLERLEYLIIRHTELLTAPQKKLLKKIASKIEWAILMAERPRALLPYEEYEMVENMPLAIRTQLLPFIGKRWIWQKMPSCLF